MSSTIETTRCWLRRGESDFVEARMHESGDQVGLWSDSPSSPASCTAMPISKLTFQQLPLRPTAEGRPFRGKSKPHRNYPWAASRNSRE